MEGAAHAASVALFGRGGVLLIRRDRAPFRGYWTLPGGRLEAGETAEECAIRELGEELGLAVSGLRFVLTMTIAADRPWQLTVFATDRFEGTIRPSGEIAGWRWMQPGALAGLQITPQLEAVVARAAGIVGRA